MDIKSSLEVVAAVKLLGVEAKKISKTGLNAASIPEAVVLLSHIDVIITAVKDASLVGAEIKDLDQAELVILGSALWDAVKAIQAA